MSKEMYMQGTAKFGNALFFKNSAVHFIHYKTAHLSLRYTTTALSFLSRSSAGIALPFEYAAEVDWEPASDTDLIWRLTSNT